MGRCGVGQDQMSAPTGNKTYIIMSTKFLKLSCICFV